MNEHFKKEATMAMTTEEAVAKGADLFAKAEKALAALAKEMPSILAAVRDGGNLGGIETMQLTARYSVTINSAYSLIADLHQEVTLKAKDKGIDLPSIESGGGR